MFKCGFVRSNFAFAIWRHVLSSTRLYASKAEDALGLFSSAVSRS
jgi:hypothetical protein